MLIAIDEYFQIKEFMQTISGADRYICFMPRATDRMGNGCIANLTLWKDNVSAMYHANDYLSFNFEGESFMAGILNNLNQLVHFLAPSHNSLKRI